MRCFLSGERPGKPPDAIALDAVVSLCEWWTHNRFLILSKKRVRQSWSAEKTGFDQLFCERPIICTADSRRDMHQ